MIEMNKPRIFEIILFVLIVCLSCYIGYKTGINDASNNCMVLVKEITNETICKLIT